MTIFQVDLLFYSLRGGREMHLNIFKLLLILGLLLPAITFAKQ